MWGVPRGMALAKSWLTNLSEGKDNKKRNNKNRFSLFFVSLHPIQLRYAILQCNLKRNPHVALMQVLCVLEDVPRAGCPAFVIKSSAPQRAQS